MPIDGPFGSHVVHCVPIVKQVLPLVWFIEGSFERLQGTTRGCVDVALQPPGRPVLEAQLAASQGRLRGVRPLLAWACRCSASASRKSCDVGGAGARLAAVGGRLRRGYVQLWNAYKRRTRHRSQSERRAMFYGSACTVYRLPELKQRCHGMHFV
jgi:hypothetical protein